MTAITLQDHLAQRTGPKIEVDVPAAKQYFSHIAGQRYVFQDGYEVYFLGKPGRGILELRTDLGWVDKEGRFHPYYTELDAIIGRQPNIFVDDNVAGFGIEDASSILPTPVSEMEVLTANRLLMQSGFNIAEQVDNVTKPDVDIQRAMSIATTAADANQINPIDAARAAATVRLAARSQQSA